MSGALNTGRPGQVRRLLPEKDELREQPVTSALAQRLPDSVTSAWPRPRQGGATSCRASRAATWASTSPPSGRSDKIARA